MCWGCGCRVYWGCRVCWEVVVECAGVVGCAGSVVVGGAGGVVKCARDTTTTCLLLCYTGVHLYTGVLMDCPMLGQWSTSSLNLLVSVEAIPDVQVMAQRTCVCIVFKSHHTAPSSLPLVKVLACTAVPPVCPGSLGWGRGRTPGLAALDSKAMKRAVKCGNVVLVRGVVLWAFR